MARLAATLAWVSRHLVATSLIGLVGASAVAYPLLREKTARESVTRAQKLEKALVAMKEESDELRKSYAQLETDRDNVLKQTKKLLEEKAQWVNLEEDLDALKKSNAALTSQKDKLHKESQKVKAELETVSGHFTRLKNAYQELQVKHGALDTENEHLRKAVGDRVEAAPQYKALSKQARDLAAQSAKQNQTIKALEDTLKRSQDRVKKIQDRDQKFAKQVEGLRKELNDLKREHDRLVRVNTEMNRLVGEAPARFKDIAEENKRLIKETAEMHYNMGVFFAENQKYDRAVKEFMRSVEINPNNAKAHYNLGYLYAEELRRHDLAVRHFNKFLALHPSGKETDVVRSYILARETYDPKIAG